VSYAYCEMCGRPAPRREMKVVYVENVKLTVCQSCYSRLVKGDIAREIKEEVSKAPVRRERPKMERKPEDRALEEYEVVPDFAERVRQARERLGLTQKALADLVKESENTIKRIEAGRLVPTIELARRLESVLMVKLLEPVVDRAEAYLPSPSKVKDVTLGDVVILKKREK